MANKKKELSAAEQYREERKQRLASTAKKKGKGAKGSGKAAGIVQKLLAVVVMLAVICGCAYYFLSQLGLREKYTTVTTIGDYKVSSVIYNYYYRVMYENYMSQISQYAAYIGYDMTKAPSEQEYKNMGGEEGEEPEFKMWSDFFEHSVLEMLQQTIALYQEALKQDEYKNLTKDEQKQIDDEVETLRKSASESSFSVNAYLKNVYGEGFTEKVFREQMKIELLSKRYGDSVKAGKEDAYTNEKLTELYNKDKDSYDLIDMRSYTVQPESLTKKDGETDEAFKTREEAAKAAAKTKAEDLLSKAKDEAAFVAQVKELNKATKDFDVDTTTLKLRQSKGNLTSTSEDMTKWVLDAARKAGDTKLFDLSSGYMVVFVTRPRYAPHSVDVRHLLVSFKEDPQSEEAATDAEKKAAKDKADKLYKEWKDGKHTEESFAELAKANTSDAGSKADGGLYKAVRTTTDFMQGFLNWSLDAARKAGDSGIIETDYGYHIMYFSKANTADFDYMETIRNAKAEEDYDSYVTDLLKSDPYKQTNNEKALDWSTMQVEAFIKKRISTAMAQQQEAA